MSADEDADAEASGPIEGSLIRPAMTGHRVLEMDAIGWLIFIPLLLILIPLLPILIPLAILMRLLGRGERRTGWRRPTSR